LNKETIPITRKEEANSLFPGAFAGRIAEEEKELYTVITSKGTMLASVTGKMMQYALSREDYPAVGDYVALDREDDPRSSRKKHLHQKEGCRRYYRHTGDRGERRLAVPHHGSKSGLQHTKT
jgi:hypothetical protein